MSADTRRLYSQDKELAARLPELLDRARTAERDARDGDVDLVEERRRGQELDTALTEAMRAAYAAERVAVGPRGYEDRIYRRRHLAKPDVKELTQTAERLLTVREAHRLHGIARVPRQMAGQGAE
ncbi:hypothetical protein [Spiractinospora alimapuensis]|uniref:hypothetical protein n=1 Tax=Spiractinospora alimapuensis TaxID=2820884 RepID=UPI001F43E85C|nr:hypothetical protein [Spiractinospora alimapuensis]